MRYTAIYSNDYGIKRRELRADDHGPYADDARQTATRYGVWATRLLHGSRTTHWEQQPQPMDSCALAPYTV